MMDTSDLPVISLQAGDAEEAVALSQEAGWNQTPEDWQFMIASGEAVGMRTAEGRLIATALTMPHGSDFAWISMILVTADYQRQNIASRLMGQLIENIQAQGQVPGLDATPAGKSVYVPLGFQPVCELSRWQAAEPGWAAPAPVPADVTVGPASQSDLDDILAFDLARFGGARRDLISHLMQRCPDLALIARHDGQGPVAGFVLARDGRENTQVGPLVADNEQIAIDLLEKVLGSLEGPIYIDVPDAQEMVTAWLKSRGFTIQRPFTRMFIGRGTSFGDPDQVFAIAGPELG